MNDLPSLAIVEVVKITLAPTLFVGNKKSRFVRNKRNDSEIESWEFHHAKGALKSTLKLPLAGSRGKKDGVIYDTGRMARYWSLDANGVEAFALDLDSSQAKISKHFKAGGFSIRCIRK